MYRGTKEKSPLIVFLHPWLHIFHLLGLLIHMFSKLSLWFRWDQTRSRWNQLIAVPFLSGQLTPCRERRACLCCEVFLRSAVCTAEALPAASRAEIQASRQSSAAGHCCQLSHCTSAAEVPSQGTALPIWSLTWGLCQSLVYSSKPGPLIWPWASVFWHNL